jgi:hypothetical protein
MSRVQTNTDVLTGVREELRPQKLSFTEIAKAVGERWRSLPPEEKELYGTSAAIAKEKYNQAMAEYKKTDNYQDYMKYLAEFKAKNAASSGGSYGLSSSGRTDCPQDGKRRRVEKEPSRGSSTSKS